MFGRWNHFEFPTNSCTKDLLAQSSMCAKSFNIHSISIHGYLYYGLIKVWWLCGLFAKFVKLLAFAFTQVWCVATQIKKNYDTWNQSVFFKFWMKPIITIHHSGWIPIFRCKTWTTFSHGKVAFWGKSEGIIFLSNEAARRGIIGDPASNPLIRSIARKCRPPDPPISEDCSTLSQITWDPKMVELCSSSQFACWTFAHPQNFQKVQLEHCERIEEGQILNLIAEAATMDGKIEHF